MLTESEVITALDSSTLEASQALEVLKQYSKQCQGESDAKVASKPEDIDLPNRANIECAFKIALALVETSRYRLEGIEALEEAYEMALQTDATADLAEKINAKIKEKTKDTP